MKRTLPIDLLDKYRSGKCTASEIALLTAWYRSFEQDSDGLAALDALAESELQSRMYAVILAQIAPIITSGKQRNVYSFKQWTYLAAAVTLFVAGALTFTFQNFSSSFPSLRQNAGFKTINNQTAQITKIVLSDNSTVWLNPHSKITFPTHFAKTVRRVSISGECFFEVSKNPSRPFVILSSNMITTVWGTSFLVRDLGAGRPAEVAVLTGKVSVRLNQAAAANLLNLTFAKKEVMLYPHQKVIFSGTDHAFQAAAVGLNTPLQAWSRYNLVLENKLLKNIIPLLESKFNVRIIIVNDKLNNYVLHADLTGFNLAEVLEALKKSMGIAYTIDNNLIKLN